MGKGRARKPPLDAKTLEQFKVVIQPYIDALRKSNQELLKARDELAALREENTQLRRLLWEDYNADDEQTGAGEGVSGTDG